jgi:hypothetical protein
MRRVGFAVAALAIILGGAAKGTTLDAASVNGAQWSGRDAEALDPALVHAPTLPRRTWRTLRVVRAHSVPKSSALCLLFAMRLWNSLGLYRLSLEEWGECRVGEKNQAASQGR